MSLKVHAGVNKRTGFNGLQARGLVARGLAAR